MSMKESDIFCRDASLAAQEPLFGTAAADTDLWLVLEVNTQWGPKGLEDSGVPNAVVECLQRFVSKHRRARVQLIRRPERQAQRSQLFLAHSAERHQQLQRVDLAELDGIASLDLEAFAAGEVLPGARIVTEPLYLVCVHGKRDRCCAQHGMPLYNALAQAVPDLTFQTTHLGGHRFAATMLVLPHGISYGRVLSSEAPAIIAAHSKGELYDLERLRGRTAYASAVQAADYWIRKQLGELRLSGLTLIGVESIDAAKRVSFADEAGATHVIDVASERLGPVVSSCGAPAKPVDRFVSLRLGARS